MQISYIPEIFTKSSKRKQLWWDLRWMRYFKKEPNSFRLSFVAPLWKCNSKHVRIPRVRFVSLQQHEYIWICLYQRLRAFCSLFSIEICCFCWALWRLAITLVLSVTEVICYPQTYTHTQSGEKGRGRVRVQNEPLPMLYFILHTS